MGLPGVLERTKPKNNQMEQQQFSFIFFFLSSFSSLFSDSRMRTSGEVIPGCSIPLVFYHLFLLDSAFVGSRLQYAEVIPGCSIPQTIKHSRKTNNSWDYRITFTIKHSATNWLSTYLPC